MELLNKQNGYWAALGTRRAVAEGGYRDGYSEVVRKGSQGHLFEPLDGWTVLSCTGLAKPTGLEVPALGLQDTALWRSSLWPNPDSTTQVIYLPSFPGKLNRAGDVFPFRGLPPLPSPPLPLPSF